MDHIKSWVMRSRVMQTAVLTQCLVTLDHVTVWHGTSQGTQWLPIWTISIVHFQSAPFNERERSHTVTNIETVDPWYDELAAISIISTQLTRLLVVQLQVTLPQEKTHQYTPQYKVSIAYDNENSCV